MRVADVVVVGAGVMGAATAWRLTKGGARPVVVERFEVGHGRGSSHGPSRVFRLAYADPMYVRMAMEALPLWRELERESGRVVLSALGELDWGRPFVEKNEAALRNAGATHEVFDGEEAPPEARGELAPNWAWFRLKHPLVPGEEPSGLVRVCAAADFPSGISYVVDPRKITYVNPDLSLYIHRLPLGEWVMVDARTWLQPHGTGVAEATLYDERGRIGSSMQGLVLEARS